MKTEFIDQAARGTPAIVGTAWATMTLNGWVMLATLAYIAIQAVYLLRKWYREEADWLRRDQGPLQ